MRLFISGKGNFVKRSLTVTQQKIKKFLDGSKDGELFTPTQLSGLLGIHINGVRQEITFQVLVGYCHKVRGLRYWGKPVTIKQLKKEAR